LDSLISILRFPNNDDSRFGVDQRPQPFAHHCMIVGNEDPY
jgi:hypothetical protein